MRYFQMLAVILAALLSDATGGPSDVQPAPVPAQFGFANIDRLAGEGAAKPFQDTSPKLPQPIANLSYDQYRDIRYRPQDAIWHGQSMFEVQMFHRGVNFDKHMNLD